MYCPDVSKFLEKISCCVNYLFLKSFQYQALFERSGSKGLGWGWAVHIASIAGAGLGLKMVIYSGLTNVKCSDLCQPLNFHRMAVL